MKFWASGQTRGPNKSILKYSLWHNTWRRWWKSQWRLRFPPTRSSWGKGSLRRCSGCMAYRRPLVCQAEGPRRKQYQKKGCNLYHYISLNKLRFHYICEFQTAKNSAFNLATLARLPSGWLARCASQTETPTILWQKCDSVKTDIALNYSEKQCVQICSSLMVFLFFIQLKRIISTQKTQPRWFSNHWGKILLCLSTSEIKIKNKNLLDQKVTVRPINSMIESLHFFLLLHCCNRFVQVGFGSVVYSDSINV